MLRQHEAEDLAPLAEKLHQDTKRTRWLTLTFLLAVYALLIALGWVLKHDAFKFMGPSGLVTVLAINLVRRNKRRCQSYEDAVQALSQRASRMELEAILRLRAACFDSHPPEEAKLQMVCETMLRRHLPRATEDELQRLSPEARRCLASLLHPSLGSIWTRPAFAPNQEPNASQTELATAILLALTSLRQPGGERSARRVLKHFKNEALREAAHGIAGCPVRPRTDCHGSETVQESAPHSRDHERTGRLQFVCQAWGRCNCESWGQL